MTQRGYWERRLQDYGLNGMVGTVAHVERLWRDGDRALVEVAGLLREAGGKVSSELEGAAADRAHEAIAGAAGVCDEHAGTFARGAATLGQSATALSAAQREYAAMGEPPALSLTPFDPDSTPRQDLQRQAANDQAQQDHSGAMAAREERARAAVQAVEGQYDDSTRVLNQIAGYTPPEADSRGMDTSVYGGAGAPAGGAGGSAGGSGVGGGHYVGTSGVATGGHHTQQPQQPTIEQPPATIEQPPTTQPPTTQPPTTQPTVTVPAGTEPAVGPSNPGGGVGTPQGPTLPAGAVGGAGVAPAASASSAAGLAGAVGGALVGGGAALGGLRGGVLGAAGGATSRGAAVRGIGATSRAATSGALGRPATAGGTVGRQASAGGRGAGAGVRGAATGATGTRGQSGTRGAGGGSARGGQGGARGGARVAGSGVAGGRRTGRGDDEKSQEQQFIEDERDWIDDEDAGPGVLG